MWRDQIRGETQEVRGAMAELVEALHEERDAYRERDLDAAAVARDQVRQREDEIVELAATISGLADELIEAVREEERRFAVEQQARGG
jgi:hypothetical protein